MLELPHSGHDYSLLLSRWEALAADRNWQQTVLSEEGGYPVLAIENEAAALGKAGGIYLSAGVHGDECAPVWAILQWCETAGGTEDRPLTILPCFNPFGLVENTRRDHRGVDLNRAFHDTGYPLIVAWQKFLQARRFDIAVNLHEDYDATGIYLYELARSGSPGDRLLSSCENIIPRETADSVDGSEFANGLLRREIDDDIMRRVVEEDLGGGWPEAIWLYLHHATDAFTFETPSEMALERRIAAHYRFLESL